MSDIEDNNDVPAEKENFYDDNVLDKIGDHSNDGFYNLEGLDIKDTRYNNEYDLGNAQKVFVDGEEKDFIRKDKVEDLKFKANMRRGKVVLICYNEGEKIEFVF